MQKQAKYSNLILKVLICGLPVPQEAFLSITISCFEAFTVAEYYKKFFEA